MTRFPAAGSSHELEKSRHFGRYLLITAGVVLFLEVLNYLSYAILKRRVLHMQRWGLNVCCGKTDGGGINADIVQHADLPRFVKVDVNHLPFKNRAFDSVLSSHTIEHVEQPQVFFDELQRVGTHVTLVVPPLWDLSAAANLLEHRWVFLTFKTVHTTLPRYVPLPLARFVQSLIGQRVHA
ncbi:MAG: methyltransferase domain-containing protein [Anaerolineae bacterium]|nr:methyltransferase domain-containing protein [Anaerolineae bacterium]